MPRSLEMETLRVGQPVRQRRVEVSIETLVLITTPEFVINPHLKKVNYDPITGFESICYLARSPQLIAVNSETPGRRNPSNR